MDKRSGIKQILFVALLLCACLLISLQDGQNDTKEESDTQTIVLWYTDEALTNYLNSAAFSYNKNRAVRVKTELVSAVDFLEHINDVSVHDDAQEAMPDLIVMTNDNLEKAYLAGLATEIADGGVWVNEENFPKAALSAVSYHDQYVGYPFYFETALLLYNQTYLQQLAEKMTEQEEIAEEMQAESLEMDMGQADQENGQKEPEMAGLIPAKIEDILAFADEYDAPEQVEAVFKWDVSDIFYNYFMVGNYMDVGGDAGDRPDQIHIYNEDTIACLKVYQNLNQFFSIDPKEVSYDRILEEFIDGKTVFTVATTDAIGKLERAKENGAFAYDYGVTTLPDVSEGRTSRTLSVTNAVVVNGYSCHKAVANDFAKFLTFDAAQELYERTDKIAARNLTYQNENINTALREYESSVPLPKMLGTSNFWVQLEICFTDIWNGADVDEALKNLSSQIMSQIAEEE